MNNNRGECCVIRLFFSILFVSVVHLSTIEAANAKSVPDSKRWAERYSGQLKKCKSVGCALKALNRALNKISDRPDYRDVAANLQTVIAALKTAPRPESYDLKSVNVPCNGGNCLKKRAKAAEKSNQEGYKKAKKEYDVNIANAVKPVGLDQDYEKPFRKLLKKEYYTKLVPKKKPK